MNDKAHSGNPDEAAVREVLERWLAAARKSDIDGIFSCYADDIVAYDAILALRFVGAEAYRKHWRACIEMCPGPVLFQMGELKVEASADTAFAFYLLRCGAVDEKGVEQASWMRVTVCLKKRAQGWRVVHEHFSAPFDPQTNKAMFDLAP